jgi:hypothetical protein
MKKGTITMVDFGDPNELINEHAENDLSEYEQTTFEYENVRLLNAIISRLENVTKPSDGVGVALGKAYGKPHIQIILNTIDESGVLQSVNALEPAYTREEIETGTVDEEEILEQADFIVTNVINKLVA